MVLKARYDELYAMGRFEFDCDVRLLVGRNRP